MFHRKLYFVLTIPHRGIGWLDKLAALNIISKLLTIINNDKSTSFKAETAGRKVAVIRVRLCFVIYNLKYYYNSK